MNIFDNLIPTKDCSSCDVISDYVCFECEHNYMTENYPNYFYNDECFWQKKPIKRKTKNER